MLLKKCDGVPSAGLTAQLGLDVLFLSAQTAGIVDANSKRSTRDDKVRHLQCRGEASNEKAGT